MRKQIKVKPLTPKCESGEATPPGSRLKRSESVKRLASQKSINLIDKKEPPKQSGWNMVKSQALALHKQETQRSKASGKEHGNSAEQCPSKSENDNDHSSHDDAHSDLIDSNSGVSKQEGDEFNFDELDEEKPQLSTWRQRLLNLSIDPSGVRVQQF